MGKEDNEIAFAYEQNRRRENDGLRPYDSSLIDRNVDLNWFALNRARALERMIDMPLSTPFRTTETVIAGLREVTVVTGKIEAPEIGERRARAIDMLRRELIALGEQPVADRIIANNGLVESEMLRAAEKLTNGQRK